ncbi:glutamate--tRNA ligase [Nakamurella leprariae]|uniref:Glutamate--tRNA ligase n=1 Tax=Nakamurella leprariae TaxID=2803911 RepID=A0A938YCG7_9ACTN|nr:glutamate--tRNA ligase [Nakamurella leprariae]MBM9468092.1 glutamate--tRNA ligase [Nakamurella leprariae]
MTNTPAAAPVPTPGGPSPVRVPVPAPLPDLTPRDSAERPVRARFCPSPTGTPHVGLARTALFNWAFARHHHGTFVFRIEDTDAARDSEESYQAIIDALRWLGLDWDEGPLVGGPHEPYRQSLRGDIYADVVRRLREAGYLYESWSTAEDITARHLAAGRDPKLGYDNHDRVPDPALIAAARAAGREPVLRLAMPDADISFPDLVRGRVTFPAGSVPDPVLVRANGQPLYTLVNPVDDALMGITHVLRGEDILPSTPRQIALYGALEAIGVAQYTPQFGHLPFVTGEGNRKLSKRDPQSNLFQYRDEGFLREGMVNYLALLGWSLHDADDPDRDVFGPAELVTAFDGRRISGNPARFDRKKAEALNGTHIRLLGEDEFAGRLLQYLVDRGELPAEPTDAQRAVVAVGAPLVQERSALLSEAATMLRFALVEEAAFEIDPAAATKVLTEAALPVLDATLAVVEATDETTFVAASLEPALRTALIDELGLRPRVAFGPVRVAVTGRTVSPPLYESMELLGRERSLARLRSARALVAG